MMMKIWMHGSVKYLSQNEKVLTSLSLLGCFLLELQKVRTYVYKIGFETTS